MEEKNKKLTYEELNKVASDLHVQYQKLAAEYNKAMEALRNRDFDYTSFFVQMLFKVMEHPEMYSEEFVKWASKNIEDALMSFAANFKGGDESDGQLDVREKGVPERHNVRKNEA